GLTETVATLDRAGIGHCGAGATILEASRPHRHELPDGQSIAVFSWALQDCGVRWAFWGATSDRPGINLAAAADSENAKYMAQAIRDQSRPEDLVIVTLHRGGNWVEAVPAAHRGLARYLIDKAGADVIHGHSAHHLLPFETYRGKPILYGCGDLINDYAPHPLDPRVRSDLTALFLVDIDRATHRLSRLHVQPLVRTAYRLKVPEREDRGWVRARILGEREPSS
ncbi:MAG: CapA family protein, partial [Novosphingobium sp.]|nr:CapA family protein [Novosphingobium sp.]